jgi:hypothetical protein
MRATRDDYCSQIQELYDIQKKITKLLVAECQTKDLWCHVYCVIASAPMTASCRCSGMARYRTFNPSHFPLLKHTNFIRQSLLTRDSRAKQVDGTERVLVPTFLEKIKPPLNDADVSNNSSSRVCTF